MRADGAAPLLPGAEVHARLAEAHETLRAIRNGEVDALVVRDGSPAAQVFTLASADRPYRMFVENMRDGAATVSDAGIVLYANRSLAELLNRPLQQIIGSPISELIGERDRASLDIASQPGKAGGTIEALVLASGGNHVPVRINTSTLDVGSQLLLCLTFADMTEQHEQRREIEQAHGALTELATHDALTGLLNRNLLTDRLTQALALAGRTGKLTGVIFVDLDHFKEVNDTRGHAAGDSVLRHVAERLLTAVRPMDSVSRLGGDEFVVVLPNLDTMLGAIAVGKRIDAVMKPPIELNAHAMRLTASIGISISDQAAPGHEHSADRLLREADTAMYQAKSLGGSRTELYDAATMIGALADDRDTWITDIRAALDEDRFVLHAQPIVDLTTGAVVQRELLLRMRDRNQQLIPPLDFLPTAERCGLIRGIDEWVITQAIALAATGMTVAVNLSGASAGDPQVLDLIERSLRSHDADPAKLVFEITETALMQDMARARRFADRLVAVGCRIALDDFGTGFASFIHLKQLPAQYLKIDINFVRNLRHSPEDMSVVRAIVALAGDFGRQTIAEGVEDQDTVDTLQGLGVTFAQGYLFGRPSPIIDAAGVDTPA